MGRNVDPISREEYEEKMKKHIDAIRRLAKRFNPEINHITMAVVRGYEWSISYISDAEDGSTRKVSDWTCSFEKDGDVEPFFTSEVLPDEQ